MNNREWFEQLPFIVLISVIAGVMGALFNIVHKRMFRVSQQCPLWRRLRYIIVMMSPKCFAILLNG